MGEAYYRVNGQKVSASKATASQRLTAIRQMKQAQGNWNMQTVDSGLSSYAKSEGIKYSSGGGGGGGSTQPTAPSQTPVKTATRPTKGGGGQTTTTKSTALISPKTTTSTLDNKRITTTTSTTKQVTPTLITTDYSYTGSRYTSAVPEAGIQAGTYAMTTKAQTVKGNEEAANLAKTYALSTGKPYKIFRADEYIPPEWTAERVVSGITTKKTTETKQTGKTTYVYTEDRGQVLENGKVVKNVSPEGKGSTTKIIVTSTNYKVYEGNKLIDSGQANADLGESFKLSQATKDLRDAGYNVTQTDGKVVATYTSTPKFDLNATEAKATAAGMDVRREGNKVIVTAPVETTTTTFTRTPTGRDIESNSLVIARKSTATEKWIKKGEEYTAKGVEVLESVPVVGDYFKGASKLQTQAHADIDASITRISKGNDAVKTALTIAGGAPLKAGVNLVFLPANVVKGISTTGSKTFTIAEAAATKPAEFAEWTGTSVGGLPKAGQWVAEHPVEVAATGVTIGVTALAIGAAAKDATGSLYTPKTITRTDANIVGQQGGVTYADIYTQGRAPTLYGDVTVKGVGGSQIISPSSGYYVGQAQYTIQQNVPTLTGTKTATFGANQMSAGVGVDVTKYSYLQVEPSKYGMVSYPVEVTKLTAPSGQGTSFFGYTKTATQFGTESMAKTYAKEFLSTDTSTTYTTLAKGVTSTNKPFISSGVLTVTENAPVVAPTGAGATTIITPTTTVTGGGGILKSFFKGTTVEVTGAATKGGVASLASTMEAEVARQATQTAIIETSKQAGTLGTGAGAYATAITQDAKRQSTSYNEVLSDELVLTKTKSAIAQPVLITEQLTKKKYRPSVTKAPTIGTQSTAITEELTGTKLKSAQLVTPITASGQTAITAEAETYLTKQQQITLTGEIDQPFKTPVTFTPPTGYGQPFIPPFIPIPNIPELGGGGSGYDGGLSVLGRQAKGYQPSLVAKIFDIKTTREPKGVLSGVEIRPIIQPPKRRRKK